MGTFGACNRPGLVVRTAERGKPAWETSQVNVRVDDLRQAGQSYRQIVEAFESEGMRPRRAERWSSMTVRNIVTREGAS